MNSNVETTPYPDVLEAFAQASHEYDQGSARNFHEHFVEEGRYRAPGGVDLRGRRAIHAYFGSRDLGSLLARHVVSNFAITERGADSVRAFSLMSVLHDRGEEPGALRLRMILDVHDEWVSRESRWLLAGREVVAHPIAGRDEVQG